MTRADERLERFLDELGGTERSLVPLRAFVEVLNALPELEQRAHLPLPHRPGDLLWQLSAEPRRTGENHCRVLRQVEQIFVEAQTVDRFTSLPRSIVLAFNALAAPAQLRPVIHEHETGSRRTTTPMLVATDSDDFCTNMVIQLWLLLQGWQAGNRPRAKRCVSCGKWFVDQTRPANAVKCRKCPWDRSTRHAAGHASQHPERRRKKKRNGEGAP